MDPVQERVLSYNDLLTIPKEYYPLATLCFNPGAFFSFAVAGKTHGNYGHFMWLIGPNEFATQSWWFKSVPIEKYKNYEMKFVYNPGWSEAQKIILIKSLREDLAKSKWETRYDVWALFWYLVELKPLNNKKLEVCSDSADHFKHVDPRYDLKNPDPEDVNKWMKLTKWTPENRFGHLVYGRYHGRDCD